MMRWSSVLLLLAAFLIAGCGSEDEGNPVINPSDSDLVVNEFLADNDSYYPDDFGEFDDWIEIFNPTEEMIDLAGYSLSDDPANPAKSVVRSGSDMTRIVPGGFLLLWADEDTSQGVLHLDFKLNNKGESILLYDPLGSPVDIVNFGQQYTNLSSGRSPDGGEEWSILEHPTPSAQNATSANNLAPIIESVEHLPITPRAGQAGVVTVKGYDDHGIDQVRIHFKLDGGDFQILEASKIASDEYRAIIPGQDGGVEVSFYASMADSEDVETLDPRFAPVSLYSYIVSSSQYAPPLFINEFLASNQTVNQDDTGEFDDWIEIYNAGTEAIDIGGMYMTDDMTNPTMYQIPVTQPVTTTILPGGFILLWADDDLSQGVLHLGFKLSANGEGIGLFARDADENIMVDSYIFGEQLDDISEGRLPDGGMTWTSFGTPTPGGSNQP